MTTRKDETRKPDPKKDKSTDKDVELSVTELEERIAPATLRYKP
ncbi:MAG: hypothetical protein ACREMG_03520 [Gemmatimonadales bacterium]